MPAKDLKKDHKALYTGKAGRIDEVDVPRFTYVALDGVGDPAIAIGEAMGAVFSIAYPLKFMIKTRDPKLDYVVMPPEALYPGPRKMYEGARKKWTWTILVHQPVKPTAALWRAAKERAIAKGAPPGAANVELRTIREGRAVQTLHVGPYSREHETIEKLHAYMEEHGYVHAGPHHEIYLSDPRRVAPSKIKTLLRQPVRAKSAPKRKAPSKAR